MQVQLKHQANKIDEVLTRMQALTKSPSKEVSSTTNRLTICLQLLDHRFQRLAVSMARTPNAAADLPHIGLIPHWAPLFLKGGCAGTIKS